MRVMVFGKAGEPVEGGDTGMAPTPEMLEAFAAMDRFTEELVKAGLFIAAAGLKNAEAKRVVIDGPIRTVIDGPFAESREPRAGCWLFDLGGQEHGRGDGPGAARPKWHAGPEDRDGDPAVLRGGGFGRIFDTRRAWRAPRGGARKARRRLVRVDAYEQTRTDQKAHR